MEPVSTNSGGVIELAADEMECANVSARRSWSIVLLALLASVLLYHLLPFDEAPRKGRCKNRLIYMRYEY